MYVCMYMYMCVYICVYINLCLCVQIYNAIVLMSKPSRCIYLGTGFSEAVLEERSSSLRASVITVPKVKI